MVKLGHGGHAPARGRRLLAAGSLAVLTMGCAAAEDVRDERAAVELEAIEQVAGRATTTSTTEVVVETTTTVAPTTTTTPTTAPPTTAPPPPPPTTAPPTTVAFVAPPPPPPPPAPSGAYYENCDAARAAGAAPLHRGDPGYRSGLDRDDDGIACE